MKKIAKNIMISSTLLSSFLTASLYASNLEDNQNYEIYTPKTKRTEHGCFESFLSTIGGGLEKAARVVQNPSSLLSYFTLWSIIPNVEAQRTYSDYEEKYATNGGRGCVAHHPALNDAGLKLLEKIKYNPNLKENEDVIRYSQANPSYLFTVKRFAFLSNQEIQTAELTYRGGKKESPSTQVVFNRKARRNMEKHQKKSCLDKDKLISKETFKSNLENLKKINSGLENKKLSKLEKLIEKLKEREETLENCLISEPTSVEINPEYDVYDVTFDQVHGGIKSVTGKTGGFEKHTKLLQEGKVGIVLEGTGSDGYTCGTAFLVDAKDTDMKPHVDFEQIKLDTN